MPNIIINITMIYSFLCVFHIKNLFSPLLPFLPFLPFLRFLPFLLSPSLPSLPQSHPDLLSPSSFPPLHFFPSPSPPSPSPLFLSLLQFTLSPHISYLFPFLSFFHFFVFVFFIFSYFFLGSPFFFSPHFSFPVLPSHPSLTPPLLPLSQLSLLPSPLSPSLSHFPLHPLFFPSSFPLPIPPCSLCHFLFPFVCFYRSSPLLFSISAIFLRNIANIQIFIYVL